MSTDEEKIMIPIRGEEIIRVGDFIERRAPWGSDYQREYKVRDGGDGKLLVKYQSGKDWYEYRAVPDEFHQSWRRVAESPAVRFVRLLTQKTRIQSYQARYGLVRQAIELAVKAHLRFDEGDFTVIKEQCDCSFRGENEYRFVVESGNGSALVALEKHMERRPFLYIDPYSNEKKRLYEGASFKWEGLGVKVTSIKGENNLIACQQEYDAETRTQKTRRTFRISRDDLQRFADLRRRVMLLYVRLQTLYPLPQREFPFVVKDSSAFLCEGCAGDNRHRRDYNLSYPDLIEANCENCGKAICTKPSRELLLATLSRAEADPDSQDTPKFLHYVLGLSTHIVYMERILNVAEAAGLVGGA
ncbi:MAG: hypothetical protein IAE79_17580 [Anaerolinea sp.]|nr:hypothetical protein [Anaerolinea sp.]